MSNKVPGDALAQNPIVVMAADALVTFGVEDRETAQRVLPSWRWYRELTDREIAAVYLLFPDPVADGGWISGGMGVQP